MAIAHDADSNDSTDGAASLTFAHTCTGANRILIVGVAHTDFSTTIGVTYDGNAMTLIASQGDNTYDDNMCRLFYIINPSTGSNNIVVTPSESEQMIAGASSFTGVDQSDPIIGNNTDQNGVGSISMTVDTTGFDNSWGCDVIVNGASIGAVSGDQTLNFEDETQPVIAGAMSYSGPLTPAGNLTHTWAFNPPNGYGDAVMCAFKPVQAAAGTDAQINIGDAWKAIAAMQINIGDSWKAVEGMQINIGDAWKEIF